MLNRLEILDDADDDQDRLHSRGMPWKETPQAQGDSWFTPAVPAAPYTHGSGHLERVKLPHYSGKTEEYAEFKMQFRELCGGEKYPAIIELTELRQKVPKEAVGAIAGMTEPGASMGAAGQTIQKPGSCHPVNYSPVERFQVRQGQPL